MLLSGSKTTLSLDKVCRNIKSQMPNFYISLILKRSCVNKTRRWSFTHKVTTFRRDGFMCCWVVTLLVFHTPLWSTDLYSPASPLKVCLCIIQLVGEKKGGQLQSLHSSFYRCLVRLVLSTIEKSSDEMRWVEEKVPSKMWLCSVIDAAFNTICITPCRDGSLDVLLPYLKMGEHTKWVE